MSEADIIWYSVVDFILLGLVAYMVLSFLNSVKGLRYLGIIFIAAIGLSVSAFLRLPGLHVVSQAMILVMLVSFPIIFHERWAQLLSGAPSTTVKYLPKYAVALIATTVAAATVFLGSGGLVKIAELPSDIVVRAVNLPPGTTADFGSGKTVRIIVSAPRDIWGTLSDKSFSATVDAANRSEGTHDVDIVVTSRLESVKIINIKPEKAVITIEPIIKKTVPISLRVSGKAGKELIPGDPVLDPEKVEIAGPKTVIGDISQVYAQIKLNGETENIVLDVTLVALNGAGEIIPSVEITPGKVKVTLPLVKAGNSKTVTVKPVIIGTPAVGYWIESVTVDPVVVTVLGSAEALVSLSELTTVEISVSGISSNSTQNVKLNLPSGVTTSNDVDTVKVVITLKETETTKSINPELLYDGLDASLKVTAITPTSVSVVVSGLTSLLQKLTGGEVKLKLDLAPYKSAGTYSVPIKNEFFVFPAGISLTSFLPSSIDVTLDNR